MKLAVVLVVVAMGRAVAAPFPGLQGNLTAMTVTATSTYDDKKHDGYAAWRTVAYELHGPGDPTHEPMPWPAWCEATSDAGIGETLTITFAEPTRIERVKIAAGVWRTKQLFAANNQI